MRLKLSLITTDKYLPINYNYFLSAAIYKLLQFGSHEFSSFLHTKGFILNGKPYKLFCFALRFSKILIGNNKIQLVSRNADLFISSPLIENFIQNFIIGTFESQTLDIANSNLKCRFSITNVESLPDPVFSFQNNSKLLSPLVLSTKKEKENGSLHQYFFRYFDDINEINRVFSQNLKNKYSLIYNQEYTGDDLILEWDKIYIDKKVTKGKRATKKISIVKPNEIPVEIIANELPFSLTGSPELIKVGYGAGFGEKNSMGFGMGEVANSS